MMRHAIRDGVLAAVPYAVVVGLLQIGGAHLWSGAQLPATAAVVLVAAVFVMTLGSATLRLIDKDLRELGGDGR